MLFSGFFFVFAATFYVAIETLLRYRSSRRQLRDQRATFSPYSSIGTWLARAFLLCLFFVFAVKLSFPKIITNPSFFCHLATRTEFITLRCIHIRGAPLLNVGLFLLTIVFYFTVFFCYCCVLGAFWVQHTLKWQNI